VTFSVLFVCICVLNNCHRVATQLQLNILYIILFHERKNAQNVMVVIVTIMINCMTFIVLQTVAT